MGWTGLGWANWIGQYGCIDLGWNWLNWNWLGSDRLIELVEFG
jgi:hypothetical protein